MRFYFHLVRNEDVIPDATGVEITDPEDLQRTALRIIHEVQAEVDPINTYWHGWRIDVVDPSGHVVLSVPLDA